MKQKPTRGYVEEGGRSQVGVEPQDRFDERQAKLCEKARRADELTHTKRMSLAIDEGVQ